MTVNRIFVLGAGMAGLGAATALVGHGRPITLIDMAGQAGGRCRSFHDETLDALIDNGSHLVLSGNKDVQAFLDRTGGHATVDTLPARFPFRDLDAGLDWTLDLGESLIPWWLFQRSKRVPGARLRDFWRSRDLLLAEPDQTVADVLSSTGALYDRFWKPFSVAVLNTDPIEAQAKLLIPVFDEIFAKGGGACRPVFPRQGLGPTFVDPAMEYLESEGAVVRLGARVRSVTVSDDRVETLTIDGETWEFGPGDVIVSALPPASLKTLLPMIETPDAFRPIINVHFRLPLGSSGPPIMGVLGGTAEWLFVRQGIASVTISNATALVDQDNEALSTVVWSEVAPILGLLPSDPPKSRVIKEKRATIAQTPAQVAKRPNFQTAFKNLYLAGDWTDTGLPATIEGALRSGHRIAEDILNVSRQKGHNRG